MNWRPISESYPVEQRQNILLARRNGNEWLFTKVGQFGSDNPEWPVTHWCPITPPAEQQGATPMSKLLMAASDVGDDFQIGPSAGAVAETNQPDEQSSVEFSHKLHRDGKEIEVTVYADRFVSDPSVGLGLCPEELHESNADGDDIPLTDEEEEILSDMAVAAFQRTDQPDLAALIPNDGESMADFLSVDAATKRLKAIRGGANFDEIYAEWSSPASRFQALQADTQRVAYAALEDLADIRRENDRYRAALNKIAKWHGEFPETGHTWDDGTPMSYGAAFGSNGERDFMRKVAADALDGDEAEIEDTTTTPA